MAEQRADAGRKMGGLTAGRGRTKELEERRTVGAEANSLPELEDDKKNTQ